MVVRGAVSIAGVVVLSKLAYSAYAD